MKEYDKNLEAAQVAQAQHDALAKFAISADVLVTTFVIGAMWFDSGSATTAVVSGVVFFLFFGCLVILTLSGTLREVWVNGQNQKTLRALHQLQYYAQTQEAQRMTVVESPRLPYRPSADSLQLPDAPRFIPAVPQTQEAVKMDAISFVAQLFDERTGKPIPTKITPKARQIQHPKPTAEALEYLLALEIVKRDGAKQLYWNADAYTGYPTCEDAIRAIHSGVRRASSEAGVGSVGEVGL